MDRPYLYLFLTSRRLEKIPICFPKDTRWYAYRMDIDIDKKVEETLIETLKHLEEEYKTYYRVREQL